MKIVMLPGMDGTGNLFSAFLSVFDADTLVIKLPDTSHLGYEHLAELVSHQLPDEKFVLLAESFSGGLVPHLLENNSNIIGVIFVASFLSPPNKHLLKIASHLPVKTLSTFPGAGFFHKLLFLGFGASDSLVKLFTSTISDLPNSLIMARLKTMYEMPPPTGHKYSVPCAYIQPTRDRLVSYSKCVEISRTFTNTRHYSVSGPHFILQANPVESKLAIKQAIRRIVDMQTTSSG